MDDIKARVGELMGTTQEFLLAAPIEGLEYKSSEKKWSRKEILGHLIDSAINNLQRFTEIQGSPKPYKMRNYDQDLLVIANDYQNVGLNDLIELWLGLNMQILNVISHQTSETLKYTILNDKEEFDLEYLIRDYVSHMEHHVHQIVN